MKENKMAGYMRYIVAYTDQSLLCAQQTPKYFAANKKEEAKEFAKQQKTYVVDLFKRKK